MTDLEALEAERREARAAYRAAFRRYFAADIALAEARAAQDTREE